MVLPHESEAQFATPRQESHSNDALGSAQPPSAKVCRLNVGSADPHGIGDVDRALNSRRTPTFDLSAHLAASADELMSQPFAEVNVPPVTDALPPPVVADGNPPRVTSVDQVIPKATQQLVRRWVKRLQRCLRMAAVGNVSLARRLRPDDLWLPHALHSLPETRAWDWDLRPIAVGDDALPLLPSGADGRKPATTL